jgi:ATP-dependent RNA helicase DDX24/MAK5
MMKKLKKTGLANQKQTVDTLTQLCKTLKFRSKTPKVIDLTETNESGSQRMPETLKELAIRCKKEEKDLHTYYFLREHHDDATIIFCNSITCVRRLTSLLSFLKVPNQWPLHSKMQQRQRLKNLDRFKTAVQKCEAGTSGGQGAILVCTDVAARGLDIPYVENVLHYQSPFNAEVYIHRCGRTARIGREGQVLALLSPEDEKSFKTIRKVVLGNSDETIEPYPISYVQLSKLEPLVEAA